VTGFDLAANVTGYLPYGSSASWRSIRASAASPPSRCVRQCRALSLAWKHSKLLAGARGEQPRRARNIAGGACGAALGVLAVPSMLGGPLERLRTRASWLRRHRCRS